MFSVSRNVFCKCCVVALSLLCIVGVCCFYCCQKGGYFVDEIYSYGLANSQNAPFISNLKGSVIGQTYTGQELFDYLTVNTRDAFDYTSVYYNQTQDVHPPLFYFVLHTVSSIFKSSFSKWIGLSINIVFFVFTNLLIFFVAKRLFKSATVAWCGVILYGLNTMAISTLLMVRMYMMLSFFTVLLLYVLLKLEEKSGVLGYLLITVTISLGLLTQYFYVFYAFFLCASYGIWLLIKKRYKDVLYFAAAAFGGVVLFYLVFPCCIDHFFGNDLVSGTTAMSNMINVAQYAKRIVHFSGAVVLRSLPAVLAVLGVSVLCLCNISKLKAQYQQKKLRLEALIYLTPSFAAFLVISIIAPYIVSRYIYNLLPIFILCVCFLINLVKNTISISSTAVMVGMLVVSMVFSFLVKPGYLYTDYDAHREIVASYEDQPCIYITEERIEFISSDADLLTKSDTVFVDSTMHAEDYKEYINGFQDYSHIVIYICGDFRELNHGEVLSDFCQTFALDSYELLFKRSASDVYVLSRK